jgi:hypothetical protein
MVLMTLVNVSRRPHRWRWFVGLYAAGVGTLGVVAWAVRALLGVLG